MKKITYRLMFLIAGITLMTISSFVIKNVVEAHANAAPAFAPCDSPANPIVAENCRTTGVADSSVWGINGAGDTSIQGFATAISVNKGETVHFKIKTTALNYRLDIYRMGYYGGNGARNVATVSVSLSQAQTQPACAFDSPTGLLDCGNWSESASWAVPSDAVSGIYFARLVRTDTNGASHIFFIVRDDAGASDLLFQTSDTTWQAYNFYDVNNGGKSLYGNRAFKVSYNRPFHTGVDGTKFSWVFNAEYPMVRWLEANGYSVSYTTGVDTAKSDAVSKITTHKAFLSVGHDEYWSGEQRANVEAARNAGVHLAFFSGNEVYWKVRWENSFRTMVCYKETYDDAENTDPDPTTWTGTWRDPRYSPPADGGRPENALVGGMFTVNEHDGTETDAIEVASQYQGLRFWRGITFGSNPVTLAPGTIGFEWGSDVDNGYRPAGLIRLSATTKTNMPVLHDWGTPSGFYSDTATHNMTLYRHSSGALVFGASTVQWSWGLDNHHDRSQYGSVVDDRMKQATVNILADMGAQPATIQSPQTAASQSTDATPPSSTISTPAANSNQQVSSAITISGTAVDTSGVVAGVEVSVDGGVSWRPATGLGSWSYSWTPAALGAATIKSRAVDDSGNVETPSAGVTVNVSAASCSCSCAAATPSTQSLSLNGTNAYVRVPSSSSINITGPLTVEAWIKTQLSGTQQAIVERYGWPGRDNKGGYALRLLSNGKLGFYTLADGQFAYDFLQGSTTVSTGVWHHVAGVFDGGQMRIYLDGVLDGSKASTFTPTTGATDLIIGARGSDATKLFNGLIDEVRLTAGALYSTNFVPSIRLSATGNTKGLWRFESISGTQVSDSSCNANNGSIQGTASLSSDVPDPSALGLVGYWKFDEGTGTTTTDTSGNGNTGTLNGTTWTTGLVNNGLSFNGTSGYVDIGTASSLLASNALTISASIYPTGPGSNGTTGATIVAKEGEYVLARFPDGTIQWGLANTNPGWVFVNTGYVAPLNQWTHIALVYNNWSVQTYANGVLVHTYAGAGTIGDVYPAMNNFRVGGRQIASQLFQGRIDEVRVYNRGLSAADVENLANLLPSPVGYWKFDVVNGTTTPDSSANGLTGTLNGPTSTTGKVNNALSFNGSTDYVQVGAQQSLVMSNPMTLSAWIYPTGPGSNTTTGGTIVAKEGEYVLARFPDGSIQWGFANTNPGWVFVNTGQTAPLNQWTHIAVVYDGGTIKTYFNGSLVHTYSGSGVIGDVYTSMNDFRIGGRQVAPQIFQGKIDEVRVYNIALRDGQVVQLAQ